MLTPPLLMCAAVLFAIGAFLRHEMSKKRPEVDEREPSEVTESGAGPAAPMAEATAPPSAEAMAPPSAAATAQPSGEAIAPPAEEETGNYTTRQGRV